jgi:hypothetical protein
MLTQSKSGLQNIGSTAANMTFGDGSGMASCLLLGNSQAQAGEFIIDAIQIDTFFRGR